MSGETVARSGDSPGFSRGEYVNEWSGLPVEAHSPASARQLATSQLSRLTDRLAHTRQVAEAADGLSRRAGLEKRLHDRLLCAAWLHDIGYGTAGEFHPFAGARQLRVAGWPAGVCALVAWHSTAPEEAELRGLTSTITAEFGPPVDGLVADLLTHADLTSGPTGTAVTVDDRITEILARYPEGGIVHAAMARARPRIAAITGRVTAATS